MSVKVFDWISNHANHAPESVALVDLFSQRELTYAQLHERVARVGGFLRNALGVERGDRVCVLCNNSTDIIEIQFACFRLGAIFTPLNWRLAPPELEYIVGDAGPKVLICDEDNLAVGRALHASLALEHLVDLKASGGESAYEAGISAAAPIESLLKSPPSAPSMPSSRKAALATPVKAILTEPPDAAAAQPTTAKREAGCGNFT